MHFLMGHMSIPLKRYEPTEAPWVEWGVGFALPPLQPQGHLGLSQVPSKVSDIASGPEIRPKCVTAALGSYFGIGCFDTHKHL